MRRGSFSSGQWSMQTHSAAPIWLTRHSLPAPQCFLAQRLSLRAASSSAKTSIASWMSSCSTACFVPVSSTFFDFLATLRYLLKNDIISLPGNWLFVLKTNSIFTFFSWASTDKSRQAETAKTMSHLNCICEQHQKEKTDLKSFYVEMCFGIDINFILFFIFLFFQKGNESHIAWRMCVCVCVKQPAITLPESLRVWEWTCASQILSFFFPFDFIFLKKNRRGSRPLTKGRDLCFVCIHVEWKRKWCQQTQRLFECEKLKQLDFISPTHFDCWRGINSTNFFY